MQSILCYTIAPPLLLFAQMALQNIGDDSTCFILILLPALSEINHPYKKETLNDISSTIVCYFLKVNYIQFFKKQMLGAFT